MPTLTAEFHVELPSPIVMRSNGKPISATAIIDDFNVRVKFIPDEGSKLKKKKERLWTVECSSIFLSVSRDEGEMPPPIIPKQDGTRDLSINIPYFNKVGPEYKETALNTINGAILYFKYELKQPRLRIIDQYTDQINNPKWIDDKGKEIRAGEQVYYAKGIVGGRNEYGVIKFELKHKRNIESAIKRTLKPKLWEEILSDAQTSAFEGNIRRAVIELAIACEVFAKHKVFGGSNYSALAFEALEDKRIVSVRVLDLISIGAIGMPNGSFKVFDPYAYKDVDHLFRARNKVAHRGDPIFKDDRDKLHMVDVKLLRQWWGSVEKLFLWAG